MNKKGKKVLAAALAMACCASFATTALATDETGETSDWVLDRTKAIDSVNTYLNVTWGVGGVFPLLCDLPDETLKDYHAHMDDYKAVAVTTYNKVVAALEGKDEQSKIQDILNQAAAGFGVAGSLTGAQILGEAGCLEITGNLHIISGSGVSVNAVAYPAYHSNVPSTSAVPQTQELAMSLANNTAAATSLTRSGTAVIK